MRLSPSSPGTQAEGLFRKGGNKREVAELIARIDKAGRAQPALEALEQAGVTDDIVHTVATTLKRFVVRTQPCVISWFFSTYKAPRA